MSVKGGYFAAADNSTDILQRDLLCNGREATLLQCTQSTSGTRDCPADHSEDAGVKCNGRCDKKNWKEKEKKVEENKMILSILVYYFHITTLLAF